MSELLRLRADALHWRNTSDGVVGLDARTSSYFGANDAATLLWEELAEGASRERLVELLVSRFRIDATAARADLDAFLADLRRRDLLVGSDR